MSKIPTTTIESISPGGTILDEKHCTPPKQVLPELTSLSGDDDENRRRTNCHLTPATSRSLMPSMKVRIAPMKQCTLLSDPVLMAHYGPLPSGAALFTLPKIPCEQIKCNIPPGCIEANPTYFYSWAIHFTKEFGERLTISAKLINDYYARAHPYHRGYSHWIGNRFTMEDLFRAAFPPSTPRILVSPIQRERVPLARAAIPASTSRILVSPTQGKRAPRSYNSKFVRRYIAKLLLTMISDGVTPLSFEEIWEKMMVAAQSEWPTVCWTSKLPVVVSKERLRRMWTVLLQEPTRFIDAEYLKPIPLSTLKAVKSSSLSPQLPSLPVLTHAQALSTPMQQNQLQPPQPQSPSQPPTSLPLAVTETPTSSLLSFPTRIATCVCCTLLGYDYVLILRTYCSEFLSSTLHRFPLPPFTPPPSLLSTLSPSSTHPPLPLPLHCSLSLNPHQPL
jgi:hypothetical protein